MRTTTPRLPALLLLALAGPIAGPFGAPIAGPLTTPAAAQASSDVVPLELVETLSTGMFGADGVPEVLVGELPPGTARWLTLPDDVRLVGSMVFPGYVLAAVADPAPELEAREAWAARLLESGWERYRARRHGGFEPSSSGGEGLQFCMGDSTTLNLHVMSNPRGGSYVRVMHPTSRRYSVCEQRESSGWSRTESLIPSLEPPPGAVSMGGGTGGGSGEWEADGRLRTSLPLELILAYYGERLRAHGWTPLERTAAQAIAVETYRFTDDEGAAWHGLLTVASTGPDSDRLLSLRLTREEREW